MASGQTLTQFFAESARYVNTNFPAYGIMTGASFLLENFPVLLFDAAVAEYIDFEAFMPANYANGGLTIDCEFSMVSDTNNSHQVVLGVAYLRVIGDFAAAQTYNFVYANTTIQSFSKQSKRLTIVITHALAGSPIAGERFVLRFLRNATSGTDDATGDMRLHGIHVKET